MKINYVWISRKFGVNASSQSGLIPRNYLENAAKIARRNPDESITIWVDYDRFSADAIQLFETFVAASARNNLYLSNLRTIDAYRENALFNQETPDDDTSPNAVIWRQVDLARLLVLEYVFSQDSDVNLCVYMDFDCCPTYLSANEELRVKLERYGVALLLFDGGKDVIVENGFIALTRFLYPFLSQTLIPSTTNGISRGYNGWLSLCEALRARFPSSHPSLFALGVAMLDSYLSENINAGYFSGERGGARHQLISSCKLIDIKDQAPKKTYNKTESSFPMLGCKQQFFYTKRHDDDNDSGSGAGQSNRGLMRVS